LAEGITNKDSRIPNLPQTFDLVELGIYKMVIDIKAYFKKQNIT